MEKCSLKLFEKKGKLFLLKMNDESYYADIKQYQEQNYKQIILTANILLTFLKNEFSENLINILAIELMDNEDEYQFIIDEYIEKTQANQGFGVILFDELKQLSTDDSIDIRKIKLNCKDTKSLINIYNNGCVTGNFSTTFEKYLIGKVTKLLGDVL